MKCASENTWFQLYLNLRLHCWYFMTTQYFPGISSPNIFFVQMKGKTQVLSSKFTLIVSHYHLVSDLSKAN